MFDSSPGLFALLRNITVFAEPWIVADRSYGTDFEPDTTYEG